jgi:hypothetical protein
MRAFKLEGLVGIKLRKCKSYSREDQWCDRVGRSDEI